MKLKKNISFSLLFLLVFSCTKYSLDYITTRSFLLSGSWKVFKYKDNGTNKTKQMSGFKLVFGENNLLTYSSGDTEYSGFWKTSDGDGTSVLSLGFYADVSLQDLTDNWVVTKQKPTKIWLESKNSAIGEDDVLILKKN